MARPGIGVAGAVTIWAAVGAAAGVAESLFVALRHGYYFNTIRSLLSFLFIPAAAYAGAGILLGVVLWLALAMLLRPAPRAPGLSAALCLPFFIILFWGSALDGRFFGTIGNAAGHVAMVAVAISAFVLVRRLLSGDRSGIARPLAIAALLPLVVIPVVAAVVLPHGSPPATSAATGDVTSAAMPAGASGAAGDATAGRRPNVLLVTIDTLRADRTGYSGHVPVYDPGGDGLGTTPRLDALAARGVIFDNCIVPEVVTDPSHASLLTAVPPWEHGVTRNAMPLKAGVPVLGELLSGAGYATAAFVSVEHLDGHISHMSRGFELFADCGWEDRYRHHVGGRVLERHGRSLFDHERRADETAAAASNWIASRGGPGAAAEPFFLWVHVFDPHMPYTNHETGRVFTLAERESYAAAAAESGRATPDAGGSDGYGYGYGDEESTRSVAEAAYDSEVRFADTALGALLDALTEAGLEDRTVIAVTADHGEHMHEGRVPPENWFGHVDVYDEVCRVPLVLAGSGIVGAARVERQVSSMDVAPTLLALAGVPTGLGGRSGFAGEITDGSRPGSSGAGSAGGGSAGGGSDTGSTEWGRRGSTSGTETPLVILANPHRGLTDRAVRNGSWKLIERDGIPAELYDLSADPAETMNIIQSAPPVLGELAAILTQTPGLRDGSGAVDAPVELDPALEEMLEALGYVE